MVCFVAQGNVHVTVRTARQRPSMHVDAVSIVVLGLISEPESGIKRNQTSRTLVKHKTSVKTWKSFTLNFKTIYVILVKCSYLTIGRCRFHPRPWLQSRVDPHPLASCKYQQLSVPTQTKTNIAWTGFIFTE